MQLKQYRRQTVQEALRAVREDLGPDALVLSTRTVSARGLRGVFGGRAIELTASADRHQVSADRYQKDARDAANERAQERVDRNAHRAVGELTARLRAAGLDLETVRDVVAAHPRRAWRGISAQTLRQTIAEQLVPLAATDTDYAPVEVFVGPPGAGKTTTLAKIAAQERARHGVRLGLVAADGFRVGAVEQLRLFADIIGSAFTIARTAQQLEDVLDKTRRPLLLDTPGRSPADVHARDLFRLIASRTDVRTHLVLAASTPPDVAARIFDRFADARPTRLVLTKLDEAESLAPLLSLLRERKLPISYLGTGQNVPDDLERATGRSLAAWVSGDMAPEGAVA
jgi:flagellar biosynthesis protein FlhF